MRACVMKTALMAIALSCGLASAVAKAQEEIAPPGGKGRVVMVLSGMSGPSHYHRVAEAIAQMGYDVLLYDGNAMAGSHGAALRSAVTAAPTVATHGLPGKIGLVGFSLGGGVALGYGSGWADSIAVDVDWYPATREIANVGGFAGRINVPTLMFAGEDDTFRDCCVISKARDIGTAATAAGVPFTLVTYPGVEHDFVIDGSHYNPTSYSDALTRTAAMLKQNLN
jgi:dienelactone hydrolase